ncbi:MAG: DUF3426 domain-containing protein [Gammaproteobacteria bacterium]|nr:DUF3426 domain-containing protein [Gammaproteobacteria bacterium]
MYTHCPECSTYFRVTADQLRAAQGKVRCSKCDTVFNALETLEENLPAGQVTANEDAPAKRKPKKPPKAKRKKDGKPGRLGGLIKGLASVILILVLLAGLAGQGAYLMRDTLAQKFPVLRPQLETACAYLDCDIALPRDLAKLALEHKDIRLHPNLDNALLINGKLQNEAGFAQPFPVVVLTFTDNQDRVVASRGFKPEEYLSNPEMAGAGLGARESALLVLEVVDPGPAAINYTFDFK